VGLYLTLYGMMGAVPKSQKKVLLWIIFGVGLVGTPFYLRLAASVTKKMQLLISTVAFAVWVLATGGGPFAGFPWYHEVYGSMALIMFTFLAPMYKG